MSPDAEAQLMQDVGQIKADVRHLLSYAKDHGKRISSLERRRWMEQGAIGVLAAVIVPKVRTLLGI